MTVELVKTIRSTEQGFPPYFTDGNAVEGSVCVDPNRLGIRETYGYSWRGLGADSALGGYVNLELMPGYKRTGDGFASVVNVGVSDDGKRLVTGFKLDTHGTIVWHPRSGNQAPALACEFGPPRAYGGVAVCQVGDRYTALALTTGSSGYLVSADVTDATGGGRMNHTVVAGAPGGLPGTLVSMGPHAAYVSSEPSGDVILWTRGAVRRIPGPAISVAINDLASADALLIGMIGGMRFLSINGEVIDRFYPLPSYPQVVALRGDGACFGFCGRKLFRFDQEVYTLPPDSGTPVCLVSRGAFLYAGCTSAVHVLRIS